MIRCFTIGRMVPRHPWPAIGIRLAIAASLALTSRLAFSQALQPGFNQLTVGNVGTEASDTRAWGVAVADFNNDTIPDIIAGDTAGDISLLTGDGAGGFTDAGVVVNQFFHDAYSVAAGDFGGDASNDIVLIRTGGETDVGEGEIHLYIGNGDGTFQSSGFPQMGTVIGNAGLDALSLAAADVDGDGDVDLVTGERILSPDSGDTADIILWRNQSAQGSPLVFTSEIVDQGIDGVTDPEQPPYFPPNAYLHAYGLALGDVTGDDIPDLLVGDKAHYLYIYENDGSGAFSPIRFENVDTRPFAYARLDSTTFNSGMPLAVADFNNDGLNDILTGNGGVNGELISLWVHEGDDGAGNPTFTGAGVVGTATPDTETRGIAAGQLDPANDAIPDGLFGTFEGNVVALFTDIRDSDGDGIIDVIDNAPSFANAPRIDMNSDGGINYLDQLDNDGDGIGDPADDDDDGDGVPDTADNAPFVPNPSQADSDGDGVGDVSDPLNDTDSDGDGVTDGPFDPDLLARARDAKGRWSRSDTHFIIRIDALSRAFQNEFVQTFTDAAILGPAEWEIHKFDSYNGIGDEPALPGYNVPEDLPGGMDIPITLVVIPRLFWNAFGDPDPIGWINARIANPNLEISLHGAYHTNNTPLGDWAELEDRNIYSSEFAGLTLEENFQLARVGQRSLLGDYASDRWILDSGVHPDTAPKVDWSIAANPLLSFAPPFNTADPTARHAIAMLGYRAFSASVGEEEGFLAPFFSPDGSNHETFNVHGTYHASADLEVDPEAPPGMSYSDFLDSITELGGLNTWLIEEVSWATRYCNEIDRLDPCPAAPGGVNRENNMVDPDRWNNWLTLLSHAKAAGEVMTLGDYALAMQFDNAPTVPNPDQADADHDGIGDAIDDATLTASRIELDPPASETDVVLTATLLDSGGGGIAGQTIVFVIDLDGDGADESVEGTTDAGGVATAPVQVSGPDGTLFDYRATWNGGPVSLESTNLVAIGQSDGLRISGIRINPGGEVEVSATGLRIGSSYRLVRSADLLGFPGVVEDGFVATATTATFTDSAPPTGRAFYRIEELD